MKGLVKIGKENGVNIYKFKRKRSIRVRRDYRRKLRTKIAYFTRNIQRKFR